ncbi:MAG TPA: sigma 54-interacting transcriptional regulator [Polyangia bacterium]|nr:sigma 54-interacting transcriptional regulator [Polyangia bacterium]
MGIGGATNSQTTLMEADDDVGGGGVGVLHVLVMSPDSFLSLPLPGVGTVDVGRSSRCPIRLEDPLASREHARLHVRASEAGVVLMIEDLGSANGTRVRDRPINPDEPTPFLPGEAITIGSTVLMVQQNRPAVGLRRLWSHGYFESRLEDECARAATTGASFALARVRIAGPAPWTNVVPAMVRTIPLPHLFAAYGPRDYEILFVEIPPDQVMRLVDALAGELGANGIDARQGVAWYPADGRSADALLARANALVRHAQGDRQIATTTGAPESDAPSGAGMERIRELGKRAAGANINVLILGETGVGKDVLARTIHGLSGRHGRFVALNCAGLAPTLIETELFGHEKGAFSGAVGARVGLLEAANGGTVFLDEIGEMPQALQSKLLRTIETREVLPVGATRPRAIDVRFVAATNRDLEADVLRGAFRQDLFFRLNGITLAIPPLRERTDEIPMLVRTFIQEACREMGREPLPAFTPEAMEHLLGYPWPGNIRELKNVIERALVLCDGVEIASVYLPLDKMKTLQSGFDTDELSSQDGGGDMRPRPEPASERTTLPALDRASLNRRFDVANFPPLDNPVKAAERQRILEALAAHAGNQTRAARFLGMPRRTFVTKLEQYGIPRPQKGVEGT